MGHGCIGNLKCEQVCQTGTGHILGPGHILGSYATVIAAFFLVLHSSLSKGESNLFRAVFWQEANEVTN